MTLQEQMDRLSRDAADGILVAEDLLEMHHPQNALLIARLSLGELLTAHAIRALHQPVRVSDDLRKLIDTANIHLPEDYPAILAELGECDLEGMNPETPFALSIQESEALFNKAKRVFYGLVETL